MKKSALALVGACAVLAMGAVLAMAQGAAAPAFVPYQTPTKSYLRFLDPQHAQTQATMLIPFSPSLANSGTMDLYLWTHSTKDGSLLGYLPAGWQEASSNWIAPEAWGIAIGAGANSKGFQGDFGASYNMLPQISTLILGKVNGSGSNVDAVRSALTQGLALPGGQTVGFAFGYRLAAQLIQGSGFQSFKEMFPDSGLGPNLYHASRLAISGTLTF